jgi:GMP synthase-like glutamine amidotransferase
VNDILIVKNITREGPGLLEDILKETGLSATIVDLSANEKFPSPNGYKALVVLGGPDSANDDTIKMVEELAQVKLALKEGIPFLGICLGMQVLVKAAGGSVLRAPQKEIGFLDPNGTQNTVELTEAGKSDPLLTGLSDSLTVFHLHGETVELADGMQVLGTGKNCKNQIVKVADRAYGIQSHFELTEQMLKEWAAADPDLQPIGEEALLGSYNAIKDTYTNIGETYLKNFLRIAGLLQ